MASHLVKNEPSDYEWIVVWFVTGNKVSCQSNVTIENREPATITNPMLLHLVCALCWTVFGVTFIWQSGNGSMSNRWTNQGHRSVEMYWLLEACILKYRYIHELIYAVFGVCLECLVRMHAHSAGISSWVWHLQLSYGMTIILERICISPTEAICQGDKQYTQHSPLLLCSVEQENKQPNKEAKKQ